MKIKIIQRACLAAALGVALLFPSVSRAGGNQGQMIATFEPMKSAADMDKLKPGDTLVKVCRDCGAVTLVRVEKAGKGAYDYVAKKCESCGSENTYVAVSKQAVPFKEKIKP
jgi:predicted RNA-binding Zn-ribbon protein involved in translation (DUF1610 family)